MKLPWFKFYPADWRNDAALSLCSSATRGVWIELLCVMHDSHCAGELRGTPDQLARAARCLPVEFAQALTELQATGTAEITERNGIVTVLNRRMKRERVAREQTRIRVARFRCNGDVTPEKSEGRGQRPEIRGQESEDGASKADLHLESFVGLKRALSAQSDKGGKVFAKLTENQKELADRFEACLGVFWINDSGKWINRIKASFDKSERVLAEVESAVKEHRVRTTSAQYAEQIWKEFR